MKFKKISAIVFGRVQGVGFRFFTERMAELLHLTGWVSNEYDGSVKIVAIGQDTKIADLLMVLQKGPSMSRIDNVEYQLEDCDYNEYEDFSIK